MKFSVFTPTHRPELLRRLAQSLHAQTCQDFEWVIGLNNVEPQPGLNFIPPDLRARTKVTTLPDHDDYGQNVGYLKALTIGYCEGDYLVEVDHDDELLPHALETISTTIDASDRPEFVYSDAVHIHAKDHSTQWYHGRFGWPKPYKFAWEGRDYLNNPAFPVTAASLHDIFFSPDHVRVWKRSFYEHIGGHDFELAVGDDHELLLRTYIHGGRMVHIPEVLYIYWLHEDGSNTYLERNQQVQNQQAANGDKYRNALITEWCKRTGLKRVELGGGLSYLHTGVLGVALANADICIDVMEQGLPFADSSVGHIHAQDFLEHIPHCRDSKCTHAGASCVVGLMNEIHRVLAPNGWFTSRTPSTGGRGAFQDPTHCSFWNPNSFWYYTKPEQQNFVPGITAKFITKRIKEHYPLKWHQENHIMYVDAVLIALKEANQPGFNAFFRDYDKPF